MNGGRYDDLDEALFALSLEEPPADLRASILRATIHDPAAAPVLALGAETQGFERAWNPIVAGVAAALLAWLCLAIGIDRGLAGTIADELGAFGHLLGEPSTLLWLALGAASVLAVQLTDVLPKHAIVRGGRT
jgi:hypothetical protein